MTDPIHTLLLQRASRDPALQRVFELRNLSHRRSEQLQEDLDLCRCLVRAEVPLLEVAAEAEAEEGITTGGL